MQSFSTYIKSNVESFFGAPGRSWNMAVFVQSVVIICFKFLFVHGLGPTATLNKLTRQSWGGGHQANFYSEGLKAKWIHSALDMNHS